MINHRKIIWVSNIISPYRIATFNQLASEYGKAFQVLFCKKTDHYRKWKLTEKDHPKFDFAVLNDLSIKLKAWEIHLANGLLLKLFKEKPILVITEGFGFPTMLSWLYTSLLHKKLIVFSAETPHTAKAYSWFRYLLRKFVVRHAQAFIATGTQAKQYLISLKAPSEKIFLAYFSIDPVLLGLDLRKIKGNRKSREKERRILYVGRLTKLKGVDLLIRAYIEVKKKYPNIKLCLVGEGPDEEEFKKMAQETEDISFEGYKQYDQLLPYYLGSDLFVLPTLKDVWGLVVNEAMMCGLPVLCSKYAGCCQDLVKEGENGMVVDPGNPEELSAAISRLVSGNGTLFSLGQRSLEIINDFTTEKTTQGFVEAIEHTGGKEKLQKIGRETEGLIMRYSL